MKKIMVMMVLLVGVVSYGQSVGINQEEFSTFYRSQKTTMWCWASSAEMVLAYEGVLLKQEAIVQFIKGSKIIQGGSLEEIVRSTNGILKDSIGNKTLISGYCINGSPNPTVLFNQLSHKRPVILTYNTQQPNGQWVGHAVVLTKIDFEITPEGILRIKKFYVFDPFSYKFTTDMMGNQYLANDKTLQYKEYSLDPSYFGLQLIGYDKINRIVSGMILIDATRL